MDDHVRAAAKKKILFLPHALRQMLRPSRMISVEEIRQAIYNGSTIEDYPDDPRGPSCLMLGFGVEGRAIHVVCAPREDYLAVITAYVPEAGDWADDFKRRKTP
jgi:hypothetical protein